MFFVSSLRVSEMSGATLAAIDSCLRVADFHDVMAIIDTDSLNECYDCEGDLFKATIRNRVAVLPLNKTTWDSKFINEILVQNNLIALSSPGSCNGESNADADTFGQFEEYLHDLGLISVISSSSFSSKQEPQVDEFIFDSSA